MRGFLCAFLALIVTGCHLPAQMAWSPDGSKAAYRVGEQAVVIDSSGKILSQTFSSLGGMAWRADSKTVYLATAVESGQRPADLRFELSDRWGPPPTQPAGEESATLIIAWQDEDTTTPLFTLPGRPVWHMALSPDQNWLAVIQQANEGEGCSLYAFHLSSRKLYSVATMCGVAMCFTGPDRLAFIEPTEQTDSVTNATGFLVEVQLDKSAETLERKKRLNVLCGETTWMQPLGDDLIFSAAPMSFPSRAVNQRPPVSKLYHYSRADGGLGVIADDVGPLFALSPDGKQILIEKLSLAGNEIVKRELTVIKPNGSDGHVLRDITATPDLPMWPSWKSESEIVFTPAADQHKPMRLEADATVRFEVILYKLTEMFELQPVKTLSQTWKTELKPAYKVKEDPATSTAPGREMRNAE